MKKVISLIIVMTLLLSMVGCSNLLNEPSVITSGVTLSEIQDAIFDEIFNLEDTFKIISNKTENGFEFSANISNTLLGKVESDDSTFSVSGLLDKHKNVINIIMISDEGGYTIDDVSGEYLYETSLGDMKIGVNLSWNYIVTCGVVYRICTNTYYYDSDELDKNAIDFVVSTLNNKTVIDDWSFELAKVNENGLKFTAEYIGDNQN